MNLTKAAICAAFKEIACFEKASRFCWHIALSRPASVCNNGSTRRSTVSKSINKCQRPITVISKYIVKERIDTLLHFVMYAQALLVLPLCRKKCFKKFKSNSRRRQRHRVLFLHPIGGYWTDSPESATVKCLNLGGEFVVKQPQLPRRRHANFSQQ